MRIYIIVNLPCNAPCKGKETTTQWGACSPGSGSFLAFIRRQPSSAESPLGLLADRAWRSIWGACSPGSGSFFAFIRRQPSSVESPLGLLADRAWRSIWGACSPVGDRLFVLIRMTWLVTLPPAAARPLPFSFPKRQKICRKISKIVKIYQHNKNIENKEKYLKKCVDKYTTL